MKIRIGRGARVGTKPLESRVLGIRRRPESVFYDVKVRWNEAMVSAMNPQEVTTEMMAAEGLDAFCEGNWRSMVKVGASI